ncbi:probable protein arginine N-methyltransferase 6.1 [Aplysia californica]|uniref:Probable protein arginine N-methyltransferase 6.1 n=1 Tax=Aplysia californica TaxID=6500 RepID=A0ABM0JXT6_APLCA|nr:probable protein arginine N-methyltransferase 6.1 [Aplysia californica]
MARNQETAQSYFQSYCDLSVHQLMLKDRPRTLAYRKFLETNRDVIKDKVVMDVGAGTGILSLFAAAAGAKKVYAVEASDVALICEEVVKDNDLESVVEVIHGAVEDISLPDGVKIDVIISEWMGFYLLHESMLDSVICARDKFLSPDGIMAPSSATLYMAPVDMTEHFQERTEEWSNVYGFDFSPVASAMNMKEVSEPLIKTLPGSIVRAEPQEVVSFDLKTVTLEEVRRVSKCLKFTINQESMVHGFAAWFSVFFSSENVSISGSNSRSPQKSVNDSGECSRGGCVGGEGDAMNEKGDAGARLKTAGSEDAQSKRSQPSVSGGQCPAIILGTGPNDPPTHWKQTVIFLPQTCRVERNIDMFCVIKMVQDLANKRHYKITLELTDQDVLDDGMNDDDDDCDSLDEDISGEESDASTDHPVPCQCGSDRCRLIAALVERYDEEHDQLEDEAQMVELEAEVEAAKQLDAEIESGGWQVDGNASGVSTDGGDTSLKDEI